MLVGIASDVHSEMYPSLEWIDSLANCDVIVMAGDLGVGLGAVKFVTSVSERCPRATIIWVAGNHEFYRHNIDEMLEQFRNACRTNDRIHFLENESVDIKGIRFIGCTLWTGFDAVDVINSQDAKNFAEYGVNDFRLIRCGSEDILFSPDDAERRYIQSKTYLASELSKSDRSRTVVVTHFPPVLKMRNMNFKEYDGLTPYFQGKLDELILDSGPKHWIYGHNHYSDDQVLGDTRLISCQLGYPAEMAMHSAGFNPRLVDI